GKARTSAGLEPSPPEKVTRFTTVTEEDLRGRREKDDTSWRRWALGAGLLAALALLVGGVIYSATRPPSADRLYAAVKQIADSGEPEELIAVEPEIDRFLKVF